MGDVIKFPRKALTDRAHGKTLCRSGFHRWKVVTARKFDVRQGKLVTVYRCDRCGQEKTKLL